MNLERKDSLLSGLRDQQEEAQRQCWDLHYDGIFSFVLGKTRNNSEHDAEDITPEVFFRAFRDIASFRGDSSLQTWLITIAQRAVVDFYRGAGTRPIKAQELPAVGDLNIPSQNSSDIDPGKSVVEKERRDHLESLIANLSDDQREALKLRLLSKLSIAQTAEVMNRTPGSVKMLVARGLLALREAARTDPYFKDGLEE